VVPDAAELVDTRQGRNECPVLYLDVSRQIRMIGEYDTVTDMAIVGDMTPHHEEIVVPDDGAASGLKSAVDRNVLANCIFGADDRPARFRRSPQVLRHSSDNGGLENVIQVAEHRSLLDDYARFQYTSVPYAGFLLDNAIRADCDIPT
jgi:hypothetical protein